MAERDYPVGRGKSPQHSRFKKGQSGNPAGRPKRSRNLQTEIETELLSEVTAREGDKPVRLTKGRLLVKALTAKAISGDMKAAALVLGLMTRFSSSPVIDISATGLVQVAAPSGETEGAASDGKEGETGLPPDDDAILAAYAARFRPDAADD
jgi:hypothetical protein